MKKIFLTSGIILCMACPAFADITPNNVAYTANPAEGAHNNSYPAGPGDTHPTAEQFSGAIVDNACVEPVLGTYSGSTTLRAIWEAVYNTITLNSNLAEGGDGTPADPTTLYVTAGAAYKTTEFTNPISAGSSPFTVAPLGDTVTYIINLNDGVGSTQVSEEVATAVAASVTPERKGLNGFYVDTDGTLGDVAMINSDGYLTENGVAASTSQKWTAVWNPATPTIGTNPTRDGYRFVRWDLNTDNIVNTPGAVSTNTNVYAIWTPNVFNITYSCGSGTGVHGADRQESVVFDQTFNWAGNSDTANCGKTGYHFTGWDCTSGNVTLLTNGGVTQHKEEGVDTPHVFDGASVTANGELWAALANNAAVSCVAHYAPNTIGITYEYGNGAQNTSGTCDYGTGIQLPAAPSKVGFNFAGWEVVPADVVEDSTVYNGEE